jgi:peptidoglycan/LPS O-acetylase OafA/YrhL
LISTIIYSNLKNNTFSFLEFYSRRIKRIFPALLVVLIAVFVFGWFFLTPREYETLNQEIAAGAAFFSNFIFWRQSGYFDITAEKKPLLHLWSLAVEEQFYIFWPLILWGFSRIKAKLFGITLLILTISFGLNIFYIKTDPVGAFYAPYTRFWELLMGASLAYLTLYKTLSIERYAKMKNTNSLLGLIFILLAAVMFNKSLAFPGWLALLPVAGATLLIFAGEEAWINRIILKNKWMVWLGLISYPLYLWHWPILSLAHIYFGKSLSSEQALLAILVSISLAWITYKLIELPIRRGVSSSVKIWVMILLMLIIGISAFFVKVNNGLATRFPVEPLQRISQLTGCEDKVKNGILEPCTFGNLESEETILIYGDSHAGHLTNALNHALGSQFKFVFLGYGACFLSKNEGKDADQYCQLMWGEIRKLRQSQVYAVIHAQRWGNSDSEAFKEQMLEAHKVGGLQPKKIAIVGSIPNADLDCAIANYYIPIRKRECKIYSDQQDKNASFVALTKTLEKPQNLTYIYPYERLCPDGVCQVINGSVAYYWDDAHMSRDGALMAAQDLIEFLKK